MSYRKKAISAIRCREPLKPNLIYANLNKTHYPKQQKDLKKGGEQHYKNFSLGPRLQNKKQVNKGAVGSYEFIPKHKRIRIVLFEFFLRLGSNNFC